MIQKIRVLISNSPVIQQFLKIFKVDSIVNAGTLALVLIYPKLMNDNEFGASQYLFMIVSSLAQILNLGLYIPQVKLYQEYDEQQRGKLFFTINSFLIFIFVLLMTFFAITKLDYQLFNLIISNKKVHLDYSQYRLYLGLSIFAAVMMIMLKGFFTSTVKLKLFNLHNISTLLIINGITLPVLFLCGGDKIFLRLKYFAIGQMIVLALFYFSYVKSFIFRFDVVILKKSLKIALPVMASAIWAFVYNFNSQWLLQHFCGISTLGTYNIALRFAIIIPLVFTSFQNIWQPMFMKERNLEINYKKTKGIIRNMSLVFIAVSLASWSFCFGYTHWFLGKYSDVNLILPFILLSQILMCIQSLYGNYAILFEKTYINFFAGMFSNLLYLGLNIVLIPHYSYFGSVVASVIAVGLSCLFYQIYISKQVKKYVCQTKSDEK